MIVCMKKAFVVVLLLLSFAGLHASIYKIVNYDFIVQGKTNPSSLNELVGKPGDSFESLNELNSFLQEKKQEMINLRLFSNVEYNYELVGVIPDFIDVKVTFFLWDAKSIFILPYPKYDSNYGFKLGIKVFDKNLGGNFTNLYGYFGFSQQQNRFKDGSFDWELSIDDIKIWNFKGSVSHTGAIDLLKWERSFLALEAGIYDIKTDSFKTSASTSFRFAPKGSDKSDSWGLSEISVSADFGFINRVMSNSLIANTTTYFAFKGEINSTTRYSYEIAYDIYSQTVFTTKQRKLPDDVSKEVYFIELGTGISRLFRFVEKMEFNTLFMVYLQYFYDRDVVTPYFDIAFTTNYNKVDWSGNFRKGLSYEARVDLLSYPFNELDKNTFRFWGTISGYYPLTSWFNPSARLSATISDDIQYFAFSETREVADYLRGIRLDNSLVDVEIVPQRKLAIALNLDFMMNFITIRNFCKSYVIPFMDMLIFSNEETEDLIDTLYTVGFEGVVILDDFPGYPIRGSLGVNANDLIAMMKGDKSLSQVEYEIFIGMGFFY